MAPMPAASSPTTQALISTPSSLTLDKSQKTLCPLRWTCDSVHFFSTLAQCAATSCGANCDVGCVFTGSCTCSLNSAPPAHRAIGSRG
jgi:hypothetical protein